MLPGQEHAKEGRRTDFGLGFFAIRIVKLGSITVHSRLFLIRELADVDDETGTDCARKHEVSDGVWTKAPRSGLTVPGLSIVFCQSCHMRRLPYDLAGVNMIGVRILPVMREDHPRPVLPEFADHGHARFFIEPDMAVLQLQIVAHSEPQCAGRGLRFARSYLRGAARPEFTARHIQDTNPVS